MIKLPRTLHIEGSRLPQGKTDPEAIEFTKLAGQFLVVEEKLDGAGVSIFFDDKLELQVWHRGSPATSKEFHQLHNWVRTHQDRLFKLLEDRFVLFGEWMFNKHTVFYDRLPHYFIESDIYDRLGMIFLSTEGRKALLTNHTDYIRQVPVLATLRPQSLKQLTDLIVTPFYQSDDWRNSLRKQCKMLDQPLDKVLAQTDQSDLSEGLYVKQEEERRVSGRYKYVRFGFLETIINSGSHTMDREPIHNLAVGGYNCLL
jgi:hypothetical protein